MTKMRIEIRKPQYLAVKEAGGAVKASGGRKKMPFFFRLLLVFTYALSGLAIWYVFQKYSIAS